MARLASLGRRSRPCQSTEPPGAFEPFDFRPGCLAPTRTHRIGSASPGWKPAGPGSLRLGNRPVREQGTDQFQTMAGRIFGPSDLRGPGAFSAVLAKGLFGRIDRNPQPQGPGRTPGPFGPGL